MNLLIPEFSSSATKFDIYGLIEMSQHFKVLPRDTFKLKC